MSIFLKTFCYFILQITTILSVLFLLRGHNYPGGGFIGALIACTGVGFYTLAYNRQPHFVAHRHLSLIAISIVCLLGSMLLALGVKKSLLTGLWANIQFLGTVIKVGTPLLFDVGIFLAIFGSLLWVITSLESDGSD